MEIIRKKIHKREIADLDGFLYFKINLNQTFFNMGEFSEMPFIPAPILTRDLTIEEKFLRLDGAIESHWFLDSGYISGTTDSKITQIKDYNINNPYPVNYDLNSENYVNYNLLPINGVNRITEKTDTSITFAIDGNKDLNIGTDMQLGGLRYIEPFPNNYNNISEFRFYGEGWNNTNSSISALYKEEYLMGINFIPEIENEVFIDRGNVSVTDLHLRMSEIETLNHLESYGNGFFKIKRE